MVGEGEKREARSQEQAAKANVCELAGDLLAPALIVRCVLVLCSSSWAVARQEQRR